MSVSLNPSSSLGFKRPFDNVVKQALRITNNNAQPVAFKVKTTAPKHYCVRPNSGRVEPGETVEVAVMLQAMKEEPPLSVKCKDKFLIQSTTITPEKETLSLAEIWNATDGGEEAKVYQQKLRVVYLPPEGHIEEEDEGLANTSTVHVGPDSRFDTVPQPNGHVHPQPIPDFNITQPPQQTDAPAPLPEPITHQPTPPEPAHRESHPSTPPVEPQHVSEESRDEPPLDGPGFFSITSEPEIRPPPVFTTQVEPPSITTQRDIPAPVAAPLPVPPPVPAPEPVESLNQELLAKFEEAQAEIDRLRNLLAAASVAAPTERTEQTELRHRRRTYSDAESDSGSTAIGTYIDDPIGPQEGVPLQVVVIIALGVFITTYLFF